MDFTVEEMKQAFEKEVIPRNLKAQGGNCGLFAVAMKRLLGEGEIWAGFNDAMPNNASAHIVLKWKGLYWDSNGWRENGEEYLEEKSIDMYYGEDYGDEGLHAMKGTEKQALISTNPIDGYEIEDFYLVLAEGLGINQRLDTVNYEGEELEAEKFKTEEEGWIYRFEGSKGEVFIKASSKEEAVNKL